MTAPPAERIGVIVVHGIGEQRRFDFLDARTRELIQALADIGGDVSVDVASAPATAFQAAQDTWSGGPRPTAELHVTINGKSTRIGVHEVWWADVNEPDSLGKQVRFWLWGLGVWCYPKRAASALRTADRVVPPRPVDRKIWARVRLYLVGCFFVLGGISLGVAIGVFCRLFRLRRWEWLAVVGNYISAVKLFNQRYRYDGGLLPREHEFLDNVGEPPRVSVRRRMIRTIADVACANYDRWYVLAHSQGTIVAFNGLMETAYAWPGYLDPKRLERLRAMGMLGAPVSTTPAISAQRAGSPTMPRRPAWARQNDIAYRRRIFRNFRGLLTFGSPLEKFAVIWPALVPISREPAFSREAVWINVMDPLDPVSGNLEAFADKDFAHTPDPQVCCPPVQNVGYAAGKVFLANHLTYLTPRKRARSDLVHLVARWLIDGDPSPITAKPDLSEPAWFSVSPPGWTYRRRRAAAWMWWLGLSAVSALVGAIILPWALDLGWAAVSAMFPSWKLGPWRAPHWLTLKALLVAAFFGPVIVGLAARRWTYPKEEYRPGPPMPSPPRPWALAPEDPFP